MGKRTLLTVRMWLGLEARPLRIPWENLPDTLRYHARRHRPVIHADGFEHINGFLSAVHVEQPGKYVGLGGQLIPERRKRKR